MAENIDPWCHHDDAAVRGGACECGERIYAVRLSRPEWHAVLGALETCVELSREDSDRIANAPESDGYSAEDIAKVRAFDQKLVRDVEASKQALVRAIA